jgi:2-polyprenyl-6-methoxyphenol hydroxylase-like FAD-dependent oxidoreductase
MDRDPNELLQVLADQDEPHKALASRIVIVGDALHSMSPFKGQ